MKADELKGFFADRSALDMDRYVVFDYYIECTVAPEEAAAHLCQEQSTAQWKRVGVDEDLRVEYGAKVIELMVERELERSSYPLLAPEAGRSYGCRVKVAHPHGNFGPRLPNLLTAAAGEGAFYSPGITVNKLFDIEFPPAYLAEFEGPKFGVEGLRQLLDVHDRPLFFGVIKPNLGLAPEPFAALAHEAWLGGLDIAKDDEMLCDVAWSPLCDRARLCGDARRRAEKVSGRPKIYLANITDEVDRLLELHDIAVAGGANAVMVNSMTTGLSALRMLRRHTQVPIVGHFDFIAPFTRAPFHGVHSRLITKLQRLAGCDAIIFPGFGARMKTPDVEVLQSVEACLAPLGDMPRCLPVPAGSQWAGSTGRLYERLKTVDFGIVPGRAVFGHPLGPRAGAASLLQGWEAARDGVRLEERAEGHPELAAALAAHGGAVPGG